MDQIDREIVQQVSEAGILDISWVMDRIAVGGWIETEEKMRAVVRAGITHGAQHRLGSTDLNSANRHRACANSGG